MNYIYLNKIIIEIKKNISNSQFIFPSNNFIFKPSNFHSFKESIIYINIVNSFIDYIFLDILFNIKFCSILYKIIKYKIKGKKILNLNK